jgi:hypothetical protein
VAAKLAGAIGGLRGSGRLQFPTYNLGLGRGYFGRKARVLGSKARERFLN